LGHLDFDIVSYLELRNSDFASPGISTTVESALQIHPFLTNKANFQKSQMNVTNTITRNYVKRTLGERGKNKANSNPIQTQSKPIKANKMPKQTQFKPNQTQFYNPTQRPATEVRWPISVLCLWAGSEKWNVSHGSSDLYNGIMPKSRDQIYNELLVLKCQQGSRDAFEELVERWQKRLWHYAFKVTGSESAAWDIVQESWYGIIEGIRKLEDAAVFGCWAFRILNNKCTDWLRKQHLQSRLSDQLANQAQNEPGQKQNSSEKTESLQAAIEKLAPDSRALLMLRYRESFDISQIAEILSVPEGTVKSRLHRTLKRLRRLMGQKQNG